MKTTESKERQIYEPPRTLVTGIEGCQTLCTSFSDPTSESFFEENFSDKW
jgi:hypothetical protein